MIFNNLITQAKYMRICKVSNCSSIGLVDKRSGKNVLIKGYCNKHYQRVYKYGDENAVKRPQGRANEATVSAHSLRALYLNMLARCYNPENKAYSFYGERGIKVCERWYGKDGFINFLEDMGDRPTNLTLDRIDNDKGYDPANCRWVSMRVQGINKRRYKNNTSGCKGVHFHRASYKWRAKIMLDGKSVDLGLHSKLTDAIKARKEGERKYYAPILATE